MAEHESVSLLGGQRLQPHKIVSHAFVPLTNCSQNQGLGQQFALTEASYTTVRLCQAFSGLEGRDPEPWTEGLTLTCTSFNGTKVILTPRL